MKTRETERRRHSRGGLFAEIEDVTYRVLRRTEQDASESEGDELVEFMDNVAIPVVNVTFGLSGSEQLGEPF